MSSRVRRLPPLRTSEALLGILLLTASALLGVESREHHHVRTEQATGHKTGDLQQTQASPSTKPSKIPHILHYIYLSGFDAFIKETEKPNAKMQRWQYDSCISVHAHWEVKFWTNEMALELLTTHYPWFLPVWHDYKFEISQADAIRPFILHHYGGMYLDLDNECTRPAESVFHDFDCVLQGSGWEGVNNGMMASAPGHPVWMKLAEVLDERHVGSTDPKEFMKNHPLHQTGPGALREAATRFIGQPQVPTTGVPGFVNRLYEAEGWTIKVYSVGEFYMPCWYEDHACTNQYERGMAAGTWDLTNTVGRHWFAGSWDTPVKRNKQSVNA